jgi:hypothetical protein
MHDSSFGRLIGALVAPGKTFRSIAERPTWAVALVVLLAITLLSVVIMMQKVDFAEAMREQMAQRGQEMPAEGAETMMGFMYGCSLGGALIVSLLIYFGMPLILWGLLTVLGGTINYKTSLAVALHAMMPFAVAGLLTIPVVMARAEVSMEEMQTGSVLSSNLAAFAPEEASPILMALLSSVDVFSLWTIALLVLGYRLAAKVSTGKAAAAVLVLWIVGIAIKVGLAAIGAAQGGGA